MPSYQVIIRLCLQATFDGTLTTFHYSPFCFPQLKPLPPLIGPDSSLWDPQSCLLLLPKARHAGISTQLISPRSLKDRELGLLTQPHPLHNLQ